MTFYNIFQNLNMNYFSGFNNWFFPSFGMFEQFTMPTLNWNMPSLFSFNTFPTINFSNFFSNNIWNNQSLFNFSNNTQATIDYSNYSWNNYNFAPIFTTPPTNTTNSTNIVKKKTSSQNANYSKNVSGNTNNTYSTLSKNAAMEKALNDNNLEDLSHGGNRWNISKASFRTDIPFAKKGTGRILDKVAAEIGCNLIVTSALGTGDPGNPHQRSGYSSHHNAENPKLDLGIPSGMTSAQFAQKLKNTGYFCRVSPEKDHIDVQIDPAKYSNLSAVV